MLDYYADYHERRFWFGFYSPNDSRIRRLIARAPIYLRPNKRVISVSDTERTSKRYWRLRIPLRRDEFGRTFYEHYKTGYFYFGVFYHTKIRTNRDLRVLVKRAATFVEDIAQSLPRAKALQWEKDVYPRFENRKVVRRHVLRERSSALAEACKSRDKYKCQICGMTFEQVYGRLGREFAEAHHIIPLSRLQGSIERTPEHLVTVCANCHRMLHHMSGQPGDLSMLRKIVKGKKGRD